MPSLGTSSPIRNDVKQRLREAITNRYGPGERLPSIRDIAAKLRVAHGTAYRALCELHDEGVIVMRPRRGAFVAGNAARDLADVCIRPHVTLGNVFTAGMYEGFKQKLLEEGLTVDPVLLPAPHDGNPAPSPPSDSSQLDATAYFNPTPFSPLPSSPRQIMVIVSSGSELPDVNTDRVDVVSVDQEAGGLLAGRAMRHAGCEQVFFTGVREAHWPGMRGYRMTCAGRLAGFERGWGKPVPPEHLNYQKGYGVPQGMEAFEDYMKLNPRPRGVFCAADELAGGFMLRAAAHGMQLGRDFYLIGFDGQSRIRSLLGMMLPSIIVPTHEMGTRAAELLMERLVKPDQPSRRLLLGCTLQGGHVFDTSTLSPEVGQ